jgi:hypothetical protein
MRDFETWKLIGGRAIHLIVVEEAICGVRVYKGLDRSFHLACSWNMQLEIKIMISHNHHVRLDIEASDIEQDKFKATIYYS